MTGNGERLAWLSYLTYLKKWADEHKDMEFFGQSPACYDEWLDNEAGDTDWNGDESDAPGTIDPDIGMEA